MEAPLEIFLREESAFNFLSNTIILFDTPHSL